MKSLPVICILFLLASCANAKESYYAGSTPANRVVKEFLGIPVHDSVDFIRWSLTITDIKYTLECNYGIAKPNSDGFIGGGRFVLFSGTCTRANDIYTLQKEGRTLKILDLNSDLVHILDNTNKLLVGTGGWSYTLNSIEVNPSFKKPKNFFKSAISDSVVLVGRTPCAVPDIPKSFNCYKLKWKLVLYPGGKFNLRGTAWDHQTLSGKWNTQSNPAGQTIYKLEAGDGTIYLFPVDENIMLFADASGKLLVGDKDFSYTLNRSE